MSPCNLRKKIFRVAVRSSGVAEDGKDQSCAGQNDTILGVTSKNDILECVLKCWASVYSFRSVEYRLVEEGAKYALKGLSDVAQEKNRPNCVVYSFND